MDLRRWLIQVGSWLIFGLFGLIITLILMVLIGMYSWYHIMVKGSYIKNDLGRVNVLVLGKGDKDHQAADLTDTIMLVSINLFAPKVTMISLPRDLWDKKLEAKINSFYYWGKQKSPDYLDWTKKQMGRVVGVPIDYAMVVDFNDLEKIIDDLGGVWVRVEKGFDDYLYPIKGKENVYPISERYEHVSFKAGWQKMSGQRALVFVRSRHAQGDEGSDFARARRQQLLIRSIVNQVLNNREVYFKRPQKGFELLMGWWGLVETDMSLKDLIGLGTKFGWQVMKNGGKVKIRTVAFDKDSPQLEAEKIDVFGERVWVLQIKEGFQEKIRQEIGNK
ncbi:MAG: LCP family protein [bacterium]|nr:LCP family protein [bacterium]